MSEEEREKEKREREEALALEALGVWLRDQESLEETFTVMMEEGWIA
eukprot:CAMPEP_0182427422 /NCGR_PEP_ID=MMETSP1167-20130531/17136_1 /TAXON_ID=2988 /ORGANISM="Mallomonas Sp, Strain CCMP3275" /LENGTH=46 /DNA_ID= /DNA_START= /DNA_END= /DNA_ORIENTATION=